MFFKHAKETLILKSENNIFLRIGELLTMMMRLMFIVSFAVITGCGGENEEPVNLLTANSLKQFEEAAPSAPTAPNAGRPSVKEVGYYRDWKLTKAITGAVKPGSTIFVKVVFSEPMRLKVADDKTARPILYYQLNGKLKRFRIAKHGASGKDFVSGDAKPLGKSTDTYICKYIVPADVTGELVAAVGKSSADRDGNTLNEFYTHKEKLMLDKDTGAPSVKEVGYYRDWKLTKAITGAVKPGSTIFVKVVFSEPMRLKVADDKTARPILYYQLNDKLKRFRIVKHGASGKDFVSGDAKPLGKSTDTYICKYIIPADATGELVAAVGKSSADRDGNTLNAFYTHREKLSIGRTTKVPTVGRTTKGPTQPLAEPPAVKEQKPAMPPNAGRPSVKEVGYYGSWKLTKAITGAVKPGSTIFVKVVFSEPMRLKVADDKTARPILYYQLNGKLKRFRIAKHGASGKDFVSGDAKPLGRSTDTYICKYIVPADATGELVAAVGKSSADRDGNTLNAFYTHREKLSIGRTTKVPTQPLAETPVVEEQEPATDITPFAVLLVEYYLDRDEEVLIDPESQFVWTGTSVFTKVVFSKPATPVINRTINGKEEPYRIVPPGETHQTGTCQPVNAEETVFLCREAVQGDAFFVTITTDSADPDGNTLAKAFRSPILEIALRQAVTPPTPQPKETVRQPTPQRKETFPQPTPEPKETFQPPTPEPPPPDDLRVPVELSTFSPVRNKKTGTVMITWSTQSELNNAGFFIKRSNQKDDEFQVINATIIAGAGTTSEKQFYTYEDTTAQPNVVYYYQLEDISLDGNRRTLTRGIRLKGHIGAAGKLTSTWGELKASNE